MARKGERQPRDRDGHWWCQGCSTVVPNRGTRSMTGDGGGLPAMVHGVRIEGAEESRACGPLVWRSGVLAASAKRRAARGDSSRKRRKRAAAAGADTAAQDAVVRAFDHEYTRMRRSTGDRP